MVAVDTFFLTHFPVAVSNCRAVVVFCSEIEYLVFATLNITVNIARNTTFFVFAKCISVTVAN